MSIALVHHFHTQVRPVDHISPGVDDPALAINHGLVEVEPIQVEGHGADTQGGEPNPHHRPSGQEEVQRPAVVEAGVLEDQAAKVTVGGHNVVSFFFLTELVPIVLGLVLRGLPDQGRGHQGTVHGGEQATTEHTGHTQHVEGVHQDVVLSLEHQHEVEGTRNTQGHPVRERTLTNGVDQEHRRGRRHRSGVGHANPRTHTQTVGQFPFPTHVAEHTDQKVQNHQLVRTTVVQPLIQGSSFPNGVEVHPNRIGGRHHRTGDDVVAVQQGTGHRLTNPVNVHGRSGDKGNDEAGGGSQQGGDHQHAEPANVKAVIGAGDPLAELFPQADTRTTFQSCSHGCISPVNDSFQGLLPKRYISAMVRFCEGLLQVFYTFIFLPYLTGWPAHVPPAQDVQVQVINGLTALGAVVDHQAVAVGQTVGLGDLLRH